jgi:hypothetical protein
MALDAFLMNSEYRYLPSPRHKEHEIIEQVNFFN